jgi:hypothetical protein
MVQARTEVVQRMPFPLPKKTTIGFQSAIHIPGMRSLGADRKFGRWKGVTASDAEASLAKRERMSAGNRYADSDLRV